ncbi:MBL fold metallo-hydrolase [Halodesulfovibrio sp.]|uniref:MBL fold metallo-hydrolase n=1 Tax=Halodesulfovibrio sp. TaxID=1912772 RepID=UPI0025FCF2A7|nr:MBL fold metallo-hydrolase [Halodesulfovibrio sp.]MCT4535995.1 MBL fold metallo-hydrolase [Halodesulfovibrio sp.]
MLIRCWGARGNIPVSGAEMLEHGGATPCLEIRTSDQSVIICDAGTGIRNLGSSLLLESKKEYTLLLSHMHDDHLVGLPFFEPLYDPEVRLTVFEHDVLRTKLETLCDPLTSRDFSPQCTRAVEAVINWQPALEYGQVRRVGSAFAVAIPASHPGGCRGFKITDRGKTVVYLPDNELMFDHGADMDFDAYVQVCHGADLLIHDAQFTCDEYTCSKGWGHSSWEQALELAIAAEVQQLGLFHHDADRTDLQIRGIVEECKRNAATRSPRLLCFAMREGSEIFLL